MTNLITAVLFFNEDKAPILEDLPPAHAKQRTERSCGENWQTMPACSPARDGIRGLRL